MITLQIVIHNLWLQIYVIYMICDILYILLTSIDLRFVVVHPLIVICILLILTNSTLLITRILLIFTLMLFQITCVYYWNMISTIIFNKLIYNCITTILAIVSCACIHSTTLDATFMLFQQTFCIRAVPVVRISINHWICNRGCIIILAILNFETFKRVVIESLLNTTDMTCR